MFSFSYADILEQIPHLKPKEYTDKSSDPIIKHCIELRKYRRKMKHFLKLTSSKKLDKEDESSALLKSLPAVPELPEYSNEEVAPNDDTHYGAGDVIELSETNIQKILSKSVARILFVRGFTDAPSNLLEGLTKMLQNFLKYFISTLLMHAKEDEFISLESLDAALMENGIKGIKELHTFYREDILIIYEKLHSECKMLSEKFKNKIKKSDRKEVIEYSTIQCEEENSESNTKKVNYENTESDNQISTVVNEEKNSEMLSLMKNVEKSPKHVSMESETDLSLERSISLYEMIDKSENVLEKNFETNFKIVNQIIIDMINEIEQNMSSDISDVNYSSNESSPNFQSAKTIFESMKTQSLKRKNEDLNISQNKKLKSDSVCQKKDNF